MAPVVSTAKLRMWGFGNSAGKSEGQRGTTILSATEETTPRESTDQIEAPSETNRKPCGPEATANTPPSCLPGLRARRESMVESTKTLLLPSDFICSKRILPIDQGATYRKPSV